MKPNARRAPVLLVALLAAACSGPQSPPPPAASPTPGGPEGGLRPLSSREGGAAPGGSGAIDPAAPLPAGHPPIEGMTAGAPPEPTASGAAVSGTIEVAADLRSRLAPGDVLYVMAKKDGTTLAVQRIGSPSFPLPFQVSEGHAMVAGTTIEGPVEIVARLSKTGDAIPSPGDLEGTTTSVAVPAEGVTVTIDQVRQ